jgi:GxxExxY protein
MEPDPAIDALCERVIGCAIAVHEVLGPGLLESVYRECLFIELGAHGLSRESEVAVPIRYRGQRVRDDLRIDLLVEAVVVVEVKALEMLHPVHRAQLLTYLKLANKPAGLLINFNVPLLKQGLRRIDHPEIYAKRPRGVPRFSYKKDPR